MPKIKKREFISIVQQYVARAAISSSALRGQGRGSVAAARTFLATLDLQKFGTRNEQKFHQHLNHVTKRLEKAMPPKTHSWGAARKALNILLRNSLYSVYLAQHYRLTQCEPFLEIPMDSITSKRLIESSKTKLPRWRGVKHLVPSQNEQYQASANEIAKECGVARIHLDAIWWGSRVA